METNIANPIKSHNGKTMAGIIILVIGVMLLVDQLNLFFIPGWLFSWPMWIIAYGVYMGGKYNFRKPIWIWMIVIGAAFLFSENVDDSDRIVWPVAIMAVGTWMVVKQSNKPANVEYPGDNYKKA